MSLLSIRVTKIEIKYSLYLENNTTSPIKSSEVPLLSMFPLLLQTRHFKLNKVYR